MKLYLDDLISHSNLCSKQNFCSSLLC